MSDSHIDRRVYSDDVVIFREGDIGDGAYLIEAGEVSISKHTPEGEVELGRLGPGAIFGEMAILDGQSRLAQATARGVTRVRFIDRDLFDAKLKAADPLLRVLLTIWLRDIRVTTGRLHSYPAGHQTAD
jgi:CRP-like cAMP-binding protein